MVLRHDDDDDDVMSGDVEERKMEAIFVEESISRSNELQSMDIDAINRENAVDVDDEMSDELMIMDGDTDDDKEDDDESVESAEWRNINGSVVAVRECVSSLNVSDHDIEGMEESTGIEIGDRVRTQNGKYGVVRFIGNMESAEVTMYGVELDVVHLVLPGNDGTFNGKRYFQW